MALPGLVRCREATSADIPAMARCRATDPAAGPADPRMGAYLEGRHHPQQALAARIAYVAMVNDDVAGYAAGHRTRRLACDGEVQYLFVAPAYGRRGVATALLQALARWFQAQGVARVCVDVDVESPGASLLYLRRGAVPVSRHWYVWRDVGVLLGPLSSGSENAPRAR